MGGFGTILADPPWPYKGTGPRAHPLHRPNTWDGVTGSGSSVERYGSMEIEELIEMPIKTLAAPTAHLYLWTTNSFMKQAHEVAEGWGFDVKTILTWVKIKANGSPSMKLGYYYRGATEHILFCVKGSLRLAGPPRPTAFLSERLSHSTKPDWFYELVKEQSPGPYLELFARKERPGFERWGNQVENTVNF